mgnify:CR=1 FL=1
MATIVVMEMRGFAAMATQLSREMEVVGVTEARIRSSAIIIANECIARAGGPYGITKRMHLGGDTWYFTFDAPHEAVRFACALLADFRSLANERGIFFLKPTVAIAVGEPQYDGERFLDGDSIGAYRVADSGKAYTIMVVGDAVNLVKQIPGVVGEDIPAEKETDPQRYRLNWQSILPTEPSRPAHAVSLPTLLLDSEIIYSHSSEEAVQHLVRQQERCQKVYAFGGPVPIDVPMYRNYMRSVVAILKNKPECVWTVLSYLPLNESFHTYAWLELCRRLSVYYPNNFAFAAFAIPEGQLRPFSYHVYDDTTVHIGLRSFSPQRGTPTMSSAIMFRNRQIASRFRDEFMENWRRIGAISEKTIGVLTSGLTGLSNEVKKSALESVEKLLSE